MKILVIGAEGPIGKVVARELSKRHDVLRGGRSSGDVCVDIADVGSIREMYDSQKDLDAVVCVAGEAKWDDLRSLSDDDFYVGIRSKLMGQVNLVRLGLDELNQNGSFTLTTGILADDPVPKTTSAALVNGGIHAFVKAAALEMDRGLRVNAVAPGLVEASAEKYGSFFPGHLAISMESAVSGYIRSVEGKGNGQIIRIW